MSAAPLITMTPQQLQELIQAIRSKDAPAPSLPICTLKWADLWPVYFNAEQNKLQSWKAQRTAGEHIVRLLGDLWVMDTSIERLRSYRGARRSELIKGNRNRGKPTSHKTINNELVVLLHVLKWAARQEPRVIPENPLADIDRRDVLVPIDNIRLNIVDDAPDADVSLAQFLAKGDELDRALLLVAHSTGMRRREIALLEQRWIDRKERLVTIPPGIAKGVLGRKKGRVTIISAEALAAIDQYRATLPTRALDRPWVFVNRRNLQPYHPNYLSCLFRQFQRKVGLVGPSGPIWLHDLRRSFITLARRRGEDAVNVMALAGHSTLESQQRYHISSLDETKKIRDRIEAARIADVTVRSTTERPDGAESKGEP
jgi:site-specific recombinase XerD